MWVGLNTSDIFQIGFNPPSDPPTTNPPMGSDHTVSGHSKACLRTLYTSHVTLFPLLKTFISTQMIRTILKIGYFMKVR